MKDDTQILRSDSNDFFMLDLKNVAEGKKERERYLKIKEKCGFVTDFVLFTTSKQQKHLGD